MLPLINKIRGISRISETKFRKIILYFSYEFASRFKMKATTLKLYPSLLQKDLIESN